MIPTPFSIAPRIEIAKLFAIREAGTLKFLPQRDSCRGHTYDEPLELQHGERPRMFYTTHGARCALSAWRKGYHHRTTSGSWQDGDYDECINIEPVPHRLQMNMEIVSVTLTI